MSFLEFDSQNCPFVVLVKVNLIMFVDFSHTMLTLSRFRDTVAGTKE